MKNVPVQNELSIDSLNLRKSAMVFRAINNRRRQNILSLLHQKREMNVTQIYTEMQLEQSVASQHLSILRSAGIVKTERNGKSIIYSVNYNRLQEIHQVAFNLLEKKVQQAG